MTPMVRNFLQFVMKQPSDKTIENYDNGILSFKYCAIGSFIKDEFKVSDEDWEAGFEYSINNNHTGTYQEMCANFIRNELYDSDVYSVLVDRLLCGDFHTYGQLKRTINDI